MNKISNFIFLKLRFFEIFGVVQIFFSIFALIAFITYHPLDPSFNFIVDHQVKNLTGPMGSYFAGPMLEIFGLVVYVMPILLLCWGIASISNKEDLFLIYRFINGILALGCLTILLSQISTKSSWDHISFGGYLGVFLYEKLIIYTNDFILYGLTILAFFISFSEAVNIPFKFYKKVINSFYKNLSRNLYKFYTSSKIFYNFLFTNASNAFQKKFHKHRIKDVDTKVFKSDTKIKKLAQEFPTTNTDSFFNYKLPNAQILNQASNANNHDMQTQTKYLEKGKVLQKTLEDFGVTGKIISIKPGPVVTLYEFEPSPGIKSSRIIGLADDIARSMMAKSARIANLSGKNALGIELPNEKRLTVYLRELIESDEFQNTKLKLPLALGKDIAGQSILADIATMPHVLVAGTTGSGKSVAINTMILSLIYKLSPDQCKFIMVDPKMLELSVYDGIPHLLSPVITDPKKAVFVLRWVVSEMENRYKLMSALGVRNITGYNERIEKALKSGEKLTRMVQTGFDNDNGNPRYEEVELDMTPIPYIVVIIDEMADLMVVAGKEIESYLQRLAQMSRAAGIHIILATQRPSVDVITGLIKANFPTRISFQVTSKIDSRTILGEQGAEQLLGMGDMLYMHGGSKLHRVHGPFVSDKEVQEITSELKKQGSPTYIEDIMNIDTSQTDTNADSNNASDEDGDYYKKAVEIVLKEKKVSTSYIQRQLRIGYNRAANIVEEMEKEGIISPAGPTGRREVLKAG